MSCVVNQYGSYEQPMEALIQCWNEQQQRMECGIIIIGYWQRLDIEAAEQLADRLEKLIEQGERMAMHGVTSTLKQGEPFVMFEGGFTVGRQYATCLRLSYAHMQLSLTMAAKMVMDLRSSVEVCLAVLKGISRQRSMTINGKLIERVIDTESQMMEQQRKKRAFKNNKTWGRMLTLGM